MEHTFEKLIDIIFVDSPKPPCTYNISLPSDNSASMFQLLMTLLISGARKLYGENIAPSDISEYQFEELKRYIESVGYVIKYNYRNNQTIPKDTETKDTETKDTETKDTETKDTETKDTETKDTEPTYTEPKVINIWFEQYIPLFDCHGRPVIS
jgi:hypothetical protein